MSMTQVALLKKADIIPGKEIQNYLTSLEYDFEILDQFDSWNDIQGGISCKINGHKGFFEIYLSQASEITTECTWIQPDISGQDTAISFVWGADFAAGACIGLISAALIDKCNALIYYLDEEMRYSREELLTDVPAFLEELEKLNPGKK